jgi:hypothetical protein
MQKLFWSLFTAADEDELHQLVTSHPLMVEQNNWFPYGGKNKTDRSNFGTFEIQQSHPIPALREKITNAIDTMLLKECRLRGIDPRSKSAPDSMTEAVDTFFGIKNGDFSEIGAGKRRDIAENIQVITTGDRKRPNILIYDNGEGQHPGDFPSTFLSLGMNNKVGIRFVQGKYNFGSTGAVVFCGKYRYQLIASRLNKNLSDGQPTPLGFTLVRRHPLTEQEEADHISSWYEYFMIEDQIPRFNGSNIDVGLWKDKKFVSGSLVKLYSYQLPRGSRGDITLDFWRDLNQYLYQPALPILLYETRYERKSPSKLMLGNKTRIVIDERDKKELTIPMKLSSKDIGTIEIEATVFKQGIKHTEFIRNQAIVFTLNGHVQGSLPRRYISKQLALPMLKDSLLVHIDCTDVRTVIRQDLFMANRQNLKEGSTFEEFWERIAEVIKTNDHLKKLNTLRHNSIIRESVGDIDLLKTLLSSIPMDDDLLRLLKRSGDLAFLTKPKHTDNGNGKKVTAPLKTKRFPSIFKIQMKENQEGRKVKSIPLNGKGIINFETDVEDEYFFRPKDRGELHLEILGLRNNQVTGGTDKGKPKEVEDVFDVTITGPTDHSIKIVFEPKRDLIIGDEVELNARLTSPDSDHEAIFYVKIVNPHKKKEQVEKQERDRPALPIPIRVFKSAEDLEEKTWKDFGWDGSDIVKILPTIEDDNIVDAVAINMDSYALQRFLSKKRIKSEQGIRSVRDKYFVSIYLHSLFLYGIIEKMNKTYEVHDQFDVDDMIPLLFKSYSTFLLYSSLDDNFLFSLE